MSKSRLGLHLEDYLVGSFTLVLPMHHLSCPCLGITTVPLSYVYGRWDGMEATAYGVIQTGARTQLREKRWKKKEE